MGLLEFERHLSPLTKQEEGFKRFWEKSFKQPKSLSAGLDYLRNMDIEIPDCPVLLQDDFVSLLDRNFVSIIRQYRYLPLHMHRHDSIEIMYIYRGGCRVHTDDTDYQLEEGDFLFNAPQSNDMHHANNDETLIFILMLRPESLYSKYLHLFQDNNHLSSFLFSILNNSNCRDKLLIKTKNNSTVRELVLSMLYERETGDSYYAQMLTSQFELLLFQLLRDHQNDMIFIENVKQGFTREMRTVINTMSEERGEITLSCIADKIGKSSQQLSYEIKTHFGKNFSSLCREVRMEKATGLLKNPDLTMDNIVDFIGYTDISHFYKDFKKTFGITPGNYRKQSARRERAQKEK